MIGMAGLMSGLATLAAAPFFSLNTMLGVAAGGALMTGNIFMLRRVVTGLLEEEPRSEKEVKNKRRSLLFQYLLKMLGLFVVLAAIIWKSDISPAGLLVGVTVATIGPMYVGLRDADIED